MKYKAFVTSLLLPAAGVCAAMQPADSAKTSGIYTGYNIKSAEVGRQTNAIDMDNGVLGIADDRGFTLQSRNGKFVFKPYLFVQTKGVFNFYDDQGLDKAYNQDNVANSGFAIPYAIIGFTGKTFGVLDYNISVNAAATGAEILQQAWIEYHHSQAIRVRVGKFKTPFAHAYLTTLGETLFPALPTSLTSTVIMPYALNAVNPTIGTGFDLGVQFHGVAAFDKNKPEGWHAGYEVGVYNGSGSGVNSATKTISDDWHIPSLLYTGRLTFMPWGPMPMTQGNSHMLEGRHMQFGVSANYNVEAQSESTNLGRAGAEFSMLYNRWYLAAEAYWMHVGFTSRQKISEEFDYWGAYAQVGFFATPALQVGLRYDFMDRNSSASDGFLNMPAAVVNYYINKCNLKLSAMYQYIGRYGHKTQLDRDNDDLGLATHYATVQLQYCF